jgi:hypothetical protein
MRIRLYNRVSRSTPLHPLEAEEGSTGMISLYILIYGERRSVLGLFSDIRLEPGSKKLADPGTAHFAWPSE